MIISGRKPIANTIILIAVLTNMSIAFAFDNNNGKWDIGVCTSLTNSITAANAGFAYIEESVGGFLIPNEPDSVFVRKLLFAKEHKIRIIVCNSFIPGNLKAVGADTNHIAILKYVTIALKRAKQAGIKTIIWGSGNSRKIPDGFDKNLATRQFIQLAAKIALIAQKNDVVICLEALNRLETNFINNLTEGLEIVKAVNQPNFKLNIDIYHMLKENETPEIIEMVAPYIAHCHIAEKENRTPPGIAGDNFIPYLNALKKTNYQGNISIECQWTNFEKEAPIAYSELVKQLK